MITTDISRNNIIISVTKRGPNTMTFSYSNGREFTANSLIWSSIKRYSDQEEPTAGRINFFQGGAVSGLGVAGFEVSTVHPMTFDTGGTYDPVTTQIIDLGDIGATDIVTAFNAQPLIEVQDPVTGAVLVNAIMNGETIQFLFSGAGGSYGVGGTAVAVEGDFGESGFGTEFTTLNEAVEWLVTNHEA